MPNTPTYTEQLKATFLRLVRALSNPSTYSTLVLLLVLLLIGGALVMMLLESQAGGEPALQEFNNAFTCMMQNVAGVGLAAKVPLTLPGRLAGVVFVLAGAALRAVLLAAIVSWFINRLLARGKDLR
jgi:hypothetical protein